MLLKNTNHSINDYIKNPQRDSAPKLHQLFNKNSAPFEIPSAYDIILEKLTWFKWFEKEYKEDVVPFSEDKELQELCNLINIDWQDLDVSIIDDFLANKQQRCFDGEMLTFKDFRLKS